MDCLRVEELLSEGIESSLDPAQSTELALHLAGCERCRHLRAAMEEVSAALRQVDPIEPPEGLANRVAQASWAHGRPGRLQARRVTERWWTWGLRLAAAVLFVTAGAMVVTSRPQAAAAEEQASQLSTRVVNAALYLGERKERVVEDLRMLRLIVSTAFEGRLDQMGERVEDYRKLIERRRKADATDKQSEDSRTPRGDRT
jgi:anti-sigma factor RsiW